MTSVGYGLLILCLLALGGYFAATEGVMTALAGALLPEELQASGIGILITVVSLGRLLSSLAFGALWFAIGLQSAVLVFAAALALAMVVAAPLLLRAQRAARRMDSRNGKILAALRRRSASSPAAPTSRVAALGPEPDRPPTPGRKAGAVLAQHAT